jgi:hypothetical protein
MKKVVLSVASLLIFASLSFGAPKIHWPKLHHNAKAAQSEQVSTAPKAKKAGSWWQRQKWAHHQKKAKKSGDSSAS